MRHREAICTAIFLLIIGTAGSGFAQQAAPRDSGGGIDAAHFDRLASRMFDAWDATGDRSLTAGELYAGLFTAWDLDRNGVLGRNEYRMGFETFGAGRRPEFRRIDSDDNGELAGDELAAGLARFEAFSNWRVGSPDEFNATLAGIFDRDGDGTISAEEWSIVEPFRLVVGGSALEDDDGPAVEGAILTEEAIPLSEWNLTQAGGISVKRLLDDMAVHGNDGERIGSIWDSVFSADGRLLSVIAEVGGFWGMLETLVNIPIDQASITPERVTIALERAAMDDLPAFDGGLLEAEAAASGLMRLDYNIFTREDAFRGSYLIGDYVRAIGEGRADDGYVRVGPVWDLLMRDGRIEAVIVAPVAGLFNVDGYYALPFFQHGTRSRATMYTVPYTLEELSQAPKVTY